MNEVHPQAPELLKLMVELSAKHFRGEWGQDFEYLLYESLLIGPIRINGHWVDRMDIDRVRILSGRVNGWWTQVNGKFYFVPLDAWHAYFESEQRPG
jgi:hypothetical protein